MKNAPFFSIVIVTLNAAKTLEACLESVFKQSCKDLEIILIDGLSTDKTLDIIAKHRQKIAFFRSQKDAGIYDAMNQGAAFAKGKFIYFLNADDKFFDQEVLMDVRQFILSQVEEPQALTAKVIKKYKDFRVLKNNRLTRKNLLRSIMPPHQSIFIQRAVFLDMDGFKLNFRASGDLEFCCRLWEKGVKTIYFDRVIAQFTAGGMSSHKEIAYPENYQIIKDHFGSYYALIYFWQKIVLEQGIKKILAFLKLDRLINLATMLIMKRNRE